MQKITLIIKNINVAFAHKKTLLASVNEEQKNKALKFKFEADQIRSLLSSSLMNALSKETILYKENGKPYFANGPYFNISHSGDYAVMAVANKEVGVDIEENKPKDMTMLLKIFNEAEAKMIKEHADFYYLWCAKESLIKCIGGTVSHIKEVPSLPFNGLKTFKGQDYQCKTFIYNGHIISITLEGNEEFNVDVIEKDTYPIKL